MPLTVENIREHLVLRGEAVIRKSTGREVLPGGNRSKVVNVFGKTRLQYHRIKFALAHGWLPDEVDHKDRDRDNMQLSNLRAATHQQNMWNRHFQRKDGLPRGVYKSGSRFRAMVQTDGRLLHMGCFGSPEEASQVVEQKLRTLHGDFYRRANP